MSSADKNKLQKCGKGVETGKGVIINSPHKVCVGDYTNIGEYTYIGNTEEENEQGTIQIGQRCQIDSFVTIGRQFDCFAIFATTPTDKYSTDDKFYFENAKDEDTIVGDFVWIASRATILPGVKIGHHAVIGAGAVVNKNVPPHAVVAGIPAIAIGLHPR